MISRNFLQLGSSVPAKRPATEAIPHRKDSTVAAWTSRQPMAGRQACTVLPVRLGGHRRGEIMRGPRESRAGRVGLSANTTRDVESGEFCPLSPYAIGTDMSTRAMTAEHRRTCTPLLTNNCSYSNQSLHTRAFFYPVNQRNNQHNSKFT